MRPKSRALTAIATAAVPLLLVTACGGEGSADGATNNLTPIQGSSYVTIEPATTTTTTTLPPGQAGEGPEPGTISEQEQIYVVQPNDGPAKIANLYGITMEQLFNYNAYPEGDQHVFLVGEEVRIPPGAQVPATGGGTATTQPPSGETGSDTGTEEPDDPAAEGQACAHTVVEGDNPSRLANQYDVTLDELNAANADNPAYTRFLIGDTIIIPPGGDC